MTSIITVSPDQTSRLAEIGELTALAYFADGLVDSAHPFVPQLRDAAARAEHAELLLMTDGDGGEGKAIGTVTVVPYGTHFAEIAQEGDFELRMLAVSPLERGRGIGKELARAGMARAVEMGAKRIVLSTMENMTAAHALYDKLGFARDESLDWTAGDGQGEGDSAPAVRLLGYTWTPST